VTRCSNNYGPNQHPEKLIPLFVTNAIQDIPMPVYGSGKNTRDWIHVDDHCAAMISILESADVEGETFNIGAGNEKSVLEITGLILERLKKPKDLIKHVTDRPGHDRRYALDMKKLTKKTGFKPAVRFEQGIGATIDWYVKNRTWWESVRSGEYRQYYERMYGAR
jgi:dTDP-glucose 4,6-dehydratase